MRVPWNSPGLASITFVTTTPPPRGTSKPRSHRGNAPSSPTPRGRCRCSTSWRGPSCATAMSPRHSRPRSTPSIHARQFGDHHPAMGARSRSPARPTSASGRLDKARNKAEARCGLPSRRTARRTSMPPTRTTCSVPSHTPSTTRPRPRPSCAPRSRSGRHSHPAPMPRVRRARPSTRCSPRGRDRSSRSCSTRADRARPDHRNVGNCRGIRPGTPGALTDRHVHRPRCRPDEPLMCAPEEHYSAERVMHAIHGAEVVHGTGEVFERHHAPVIAGAGAGAPAPVPGTGGPLDPDYWIRSVARDRRRFPTTSCARSARRRVTRRPRCCRCRRGNRARPVPRACSTTCAWPDTTFRRG